MRHQRNILKGKKIHKDISLKLQWDMTSILCSQRVQCLKAGTTEITNKYSGELWRTALWGLVRKKLTSS